jgi:cysteine synthase A
MELFGAEIIEVGCSAFQEAIQLRDKMLAENTNFWSPNQFGNLHNIECHEMTTAKEIIRQLFVKEKKNISALICGSGTGGTIMGVRRALIKLDKGMSTILVAPAEDAKTHGIQGINDGADFLVDRNLIDEEIKVSTQDAIERAKRLAREDGLFVGISSGANVLGAERWLEENNINGAAVTFLCDRGERYMSTF